MMKILNKHKRVVIISLLLLCLTVGISIAFFQDTTGTLTNSFDLGDISTKVDENEDPTPVSNTTISKKPFIENTGDHPALIRVRVTMSPQSIVDDFGLECRLDNELWFNAKNSDGTAKWIYNPNDDFYYYTGILGKEPTLEIFDTVVSTNGKNLANNDNGTWVIDAGLEGLEIGIYHESVQTFILGEDGNQIIANNGIIDPEDFDSTSAGQIWNYFNTQQ